MCLEQNLGDLCPLGTAPRLEAGAMSSCEQATSFSSAFSNSDGGTVDFESQSVCVGEGSCLIECEVLITPIKLQRAENIACDRLSVTDRNRNDLPIDMLL